MNKQNNNLHNNPVDKEDLKNEFAEVPTEVTPELNADDIIEEAMNDEVAENAQAEDLARQLDETTKALEKEKKEYLFLMADFDNFRKRVLKEKADLISNAGEKVLRGLLPIVDDFERGLQATKNVDDNDAVRQGMELIYSKLVKFLGENGVKAMECDDATFDADFHEAVAMIPAADESQKGHIIDVTQRGYMINDKVLRHAKVVVAQ